MAAMFQQEAATSSAAPQAAAMSAPMTEEGAETSGAAAELQFDDRGLLHADSAQQTSSAAFESSHKVVPLPANLLHRVVEKFVVNSSGAWIMVKQIGDEVQCILASESLACTDDAYDCCTRQTRCLSKNQAVERLLAAIQEPSPRLLLWRNFCLI